METEQLKTAFYVHWTAGDWIKRKWLVSEVIVASRNQYSGDCDIAFKAGRDEGAALWLGEIHIAPSHALYTTKSEALNHALREQALEITGLLKMVGEAREQMSAILDQLEEIQRRN
jgi:hypothetical protein